MGFARLSLATVTPHDTYGHRQAHTMRKAQSISVHVRNDAQLGWQTAVDVGVASPGTGTCADLSKDCTQPCDSLSESLSVACNQPLSLITVERPMVSASRTRFPPRGKKGAALDDNAVGVEPVAEGLSGAGRVHALMVVSLMRQHASMICAHALTRALIVATVDSGAPLCPGVRFLCLEPPRQPRRRLAAIGGAGASIAGVCAPVAAHASCVASCDVGTAL